MTKGWMAVTVISALFFLAPSAAAHCDSMDGPVVKAAQLAIKTGDITPVLKWVHKADEPKIRSAFQRTLKVRALDADARDLADYYFFETLVRLHRASEGEPYTGLKPVGAQVEPGIALADTALASGSVEELVGQVTAEVAASIRRRFARVQEAGKHANENVDSGRTYVAAYVEFIHYIESVHHLLAAAPHTQHQSQK
jgi:hypothetical protein